MTSLGNAIAVLKKKGGGGGERERTKSCLGKRVAVKLKKIKKKSLDDPY